RGRRGRRPLQLFGPGRAAEAGAVPRGAIRRLRAGSRCPAVRAPCPVAAAAGGGIDRSAKLGGPTVFPAPSPGDSPTPMQAIADRFGLDFIGEPWFVQALLILLLTLVASIAAGLLLRLAGSIARRAGAHWGDTLVRCAARPLQVLVWIAGTAQALLVVEYLHAPPLAGPIQALRKAGIILCIGWFLLRFIREFGESAVRSKLERGEKVDVTTMDALSKLARLTVVTVATLMIMQVFGLSITSLLALGGIGGIAVGFAARDVLANFLGGLTIYLDRPFSVGDWIRSPDKAIEGTVEEINWRHTRVRAFNKNPIYVPNALFTTVVV